MKWLIGLRARNHCHSTSLRYGTNAAVPAVLMSAPQMNIIVGVSCSPPATPNMLLTSPIRMPAQSQCQSETPPHFSLFFLLSVFAPAQAATSGPPTEPPSRLSTLAHDFATWLNHVTGTRANNHQAGRHSPPLPRPAAEPASMPVASNKEWSEFVPPPVASKKKTPTPIQIND